MTNICNPTWVVRSPTPYKISLKGWLLALPSNIRHGKKKLIETNTSLLQYRINYGCKKFNSTGPGLQRTMGPFVLARIMTQQIRLYNKCYLIAGIVWSKCMATLRLLICQQHKCKEIKCRNATILFLWTIPVIKQHLL